MIHWFWYKTDGSIGGDHTMQGGWDPGLDFNDSGSTDATVQKIRSDFTGLADFAGFVSYDDGVSGQDWNMAAVNNILLHYCVSGGSLVAKPSFEAELDAVEVALGDVVDKTPGATVAVRLVGASVPDGVVVNGLKVGDGPDMIASYPAVFTFSGGATNTINFTAPAQGFNSTVYLKPAVPAETVLRQFSVRGWA